MVIQRLTSLVSLCLDKFLLGWSLVFVMARRGGGGGGGGDRGGGSGGSGEFGNKEEGNN